VPRLARKIVAITGASAGIGRATAMLAAREGATVVLLARRADKLDALAAEVRASGGTALAVAGDVTNATDMESFVRHAVEGFGRLDIMVCNAGIGYHGPLDETPADVMRRIVDVNLMGTLYAARAALPVMRRQGTGHIIAVSSIAGRRGVGGSSVYSATKAAQIGFIEGLRAEFSGTSLRASVIYPVSTVTEFHEAIARDFGHTVEGKGPKQSADRVAQAIVECMVNPRAEVYPFGHAKWLAVLSVIAPAQADKFVKRFGRRTVPRTGSAEPGGD
jgi:NADP-dependent 3-hydroxy acid dehydrogenase YdfG